MAKSRAEWRRIALGMAGWVTGFERMVGVMQEWVETNRNEIAAFRDLQAAARDEEADELFNGGDDDGLEDNQ